MGTVNMLGVYFYNCTSARGGGGVWSSGEATISRCGFDNNKAQSGGAIYVKGGSLSMFNSFFSGNTASTGPAHVFVSTDATIDGCGNSGLDDGDPLLEVCPESAARWWVPFNVVLAVAAVISWALSC